VEGLQKRMNIEHRTFNIECWIEKYEETDLWLGREDAL